MARAINRDFGFCFESAVGLFVDRLIVLFRDFGKRIGLLLCVRKSSEQCRFLKANLPNFVGVGSCNTLVADF